MNQHAPAHWAIDEDGTDSPANMAQCLLDSAGTPGEWVAVGLKDIDGYAESVAYCHPRNAPVISAAPDLLSAILSIVDFYAQMTASPEEDSVLAQARAAIAKAQG